MSYITVWNHGSAAQKRPVQFTVPVGLGWSNLLAVGPENLIASKQYDDSRDAVYICPPPLNGWSPGTEDFTVTEFSGNDPQYAFKFSEAINADFLCGDAQDPGAIVKPTLRVYRTASDPSPITVRLKNILPWSPGLHWTTGDWIAVSTPGDRRRWFAADGVADGWHLWFFIALDSEMAVAEFSAFVCWSDEESQGRGTGDDAWRLDVDRVVLEWGDRVSVKAKFNTEGIVVNGPTMTLSTTFTGSTSPSTYNYSSWDGVFYGQLGWAFRGFLLVDPEGTSASPDDTEFTNAAPLYAALDAESWDGYFSHGPSGHGLTIANDVQQTGPNWSDTSKHFWSWDRGAGSNDENGNNGMVLNVQPKDPGTQGAQGLIQGQSVLLRKNSPRDLDAASTDMVKRPIWAWRDGLMKLPSASGGEIGDPNYTIGVYHRIGGLAIPAGSKRRGYDFATHNQKVGNNAAGEYLWGRRNANEAERLGVPTSSGFKRAIGLDNQHTDCSTAIGNLAICKDQHAHFIAELYLHRLENEGRRPNIVNAGPSAISGDREIGRKFNLLAGLWHHAPALRWRILDVLFHPTQGYHVALSGRTNASDGLYFKNKKFPSGLPAALSRDPATVPNWMKGPQNVEYDRHVRDVFTPSQFRFGPEANTTSFKPPRQYSIRDGAVTFSGNTVTIGSGTWETNPEIGARLTISGSTSNNGSGAGRTVTAVTDTVITVRDNFTNESASNVTIHQSVPSMMTEAFGYVSPLWEMLGATGLLAMWKAISESGTSWATDPQVLDLKDWGETIVENCIQYGTQVTSDGRRKFIIENLLVYKSGQMVHSDSMTTYYPPTTGRHPFLDSRNGKHQYVLNTGGRNLLSWCVGGLNWYRKNGRNAALRAEAQQIWLDMLTWRNASAYGGNDPCTFVNAGGSGDYIQKDGGNWDRTPEAGETLTVENTASNDGTYTVVSATNTRIYVEGLTNESATAPIIYGEVTDEYLGWQQVYWAALSDMTTP